MKKRPVEKLLLGVAMTAAGSAQAAKILIVTKDGPDFAKVRGGIVEELGGEHQTTELVFGKDTTYEELTQRIRKEKPDALIVMDNRPVEMVQRMVTEAEASGAWAPKGAAVMALNLKRVLKDSKALSGIAYEVPGYSIVTRFRQATGKDVRNVLVIYRESEFGELVRDAKVQLGREDVQLIAVNAEPPKGEESSFDLVKFLDASLAETAAGQKIDAVWVLTDNALLTAETFGPVWVRKAREMKVPFLCGVEKLASPEMDFCAYAAYPELRELGLAAAEQVLRLVVDGNEPADTGVEYMVAVNHTFNPAALQRLGLKVRPEGTASEP